MRTWFVTVVAWTVLAVASPAVLGAAAPNSDDKRLGVESGLFKGAAEVSLWTILVFLVLLSVLKKYAWGPIRDGLERREAGIARDKREAEQARAEAAQLRASLQAEMARANEEIRQMMEKARQDAQSTAAEELARGKAELAAERDRLQRELRISTDDALRKIWDQSTQLATLISSKAVRKQLTESDHRALLDEALAEFKAAATSRRDHLQSARA
ncbi:MAG: hypothetical protein U0840_30945 [Gemmataceae bacterium]